MRATGHDPFSPSQPPEWTPPGYVPPTRPSEPSRRIVPVFYEPPPEPAPDDIHGQLLARRIVLVNGPLDAHGADDVCGRLLVLDQQGPEPVTLHLACPDADLDAALTVVSTMDFMTAPVHAIAAGSIGGGGVAILAAAGERSAHPHATVLLFEPKALGALEGSAESLSIAAEHRTRQLATLVERIAAACGRDAQGVEDDLRTGRLLTADEAVDYGLVHRLTSSPA